MYHRCYIIAKLKENANPRSRARAHAAARCLEKNPEQRSQSASDLAFALEALSDAGTIPAKVPEEKIQPRDEFAIPPTKSRTTVVLPLWRGSVIMRTGVSLSGRW